MASRADADGSGHHFAHGSSPPASVARCGKAGHVVVAKAQGALERLHQSGLAAVLRGVMASFSGTLLCGPGAPPERITSTGAPRISRSRCHAPRPEVPRPGTLRATYGTFTPRPAYRRSPLLQRQTSRTKEAFSRIFYFPHFPRTEFRDFIFLSETMG